MLTRRVEVTTSLLRAPSMFHFNICNSGLFPALKYGIIRYSYRVTTVALQQYFMAGQFELLACQTVVGPASIRDAPLCHVVPGQLSCCHFRCMETVWDWKSNQHHPGHCIMIEVCRREKTSELLLLQVITLLL